MSQTPEGGFEVGDEEIKWEDVAQDFLRAKMEGLYADAYNAPKPRKPQRLKSRIENFDPTLFKDKKFIDRSYGAKPKLNLNSGLN
jgi:hypothetical protein